MLGPTNVPRLQAWGWRRIEVRTTVEVYQQVPELSPLFQKLTQGLSNGLPVALSASTTKGLACAFRTLSCGDWLGTGQGIPAY